MARLSLDPSIRYLLEWEVYGRSKPLMKNKASVEQLVAAGGIVYRDNGNGPEIVLCGRNAPKLWALPKGTPEIGETREQTAVREVNEETGLEVKTQCFVDSIQYWFVGSSDGIRFHKTVLFYLMEPIGGDMSLHDHEFDVVQWFSIEDALKAMSYGNEAKVVEKGLSLAIRR